MKLITYLKSNEMRSGILVNNRIFDLHLSSSKQLPVSMREILIGGERALDILRNIEVKTNDGKFIEFSIAYDEKILCAPIPDPTSCRDGYAFRQHVAAARRNRGVPMIPEFDEYPIFYFTNHHAIMGPGDVYCMPDHFEKLDFELEVAVVIGKKGRNIPSGKADEYIAGFSASC